MEVRKLLILKSFIFFKFERGLNVLLNFNTSKVLYNLNRFQSFRINLKTSKEFGDLL